MAQVQINRGTTAEIEATPITDGLISFDTDTSLIYMDSNNARGSYGGGKQKELTQAEYNALPSSKLTDGVEYFITDGTLESTQADMISYDNSDSALSSDNVQDAIDELSGEIDTINTEISAINTEIGTTDISGIGDGTVTGAIDSVNSNLTNNKALGTPVDISATTTYTATSDGYVKIALAPVSTLGAYQYGNITINGQVIANLMANTFHSTIISAYVRKGMRYSVGIGSSSTASAIQFIPIVEGTSSLTMGNPNAEE